MDMNIKISFTPADVLIVPNILERRSGVEIFKKNLHKILHVIQNKEIFIFCRDTKKTKILDGTCEVYDYDLSTYQVLEHAKRKNEMKNKSQSNESTDMFKIPDAVIIIMVEPNYKNILFNKKH